MLKDQAKTFFSFLNGLSDIGSVGRIEATLNDNGSYHVEATLELWTLEKHSIGIAPNGSYMYYDIKEGERL